VRTEPAQPSDLAKGDRVHRDIYLDEQVFRDELERIFYTTWVYVGHESEVRQIGDFKTTHIGLQPVIVSRHDDNAIYVMLNRCTHRAATVCQEQSGNTRVFRCGYHGWLFRRNGELLQPTLDSGYDKRDFNKSDFTLGRAPRVDLYRGMIFASLASEGPSLREHLGKAADYIDLAFDIAPDGDVHLSAGRQLYTYAGNWKLQCENVVDGYHTNFVHKSFLEVTGIPELTGLFNANSKGRAGDLGGGHGVLDSRAGLQPMYAESLKTAQGKRDLEALTERLGDRERAEYVLMSGGTNGFNLVVFPNVLMVAHQIRVVHPRTVHSTDVEMYPYLLGGASAATNAARLRTHEEFYGAAGAGGPDDVEMFRRVFEGLSAKGVPAVEWLHFARGLRRTVVEDGVEFGHATDEHPQRGFYRQWLRMMEAADR